MVTPSGTFTYGYDGDGRMQSLVNPAGETSGWTYLDNSWLGLDTRRNANGAIFAATLTDAPLISRRAS